MDILHFPKIYIAFEVLKISKLQELLNRKNIQKVLTKWFFLLLGVIGLVNVILGVSCEGLTIFCEGASLFLLVGGEGGKEALQTRQTLTLIT